MAVIDLLFAIKFPSVFDVLAIDSTGCVTCDKIVEGRDFTTPQILSPIELEVSADAIVCNAGDSAVGDGLGDDADVP